MDKSHDYGHGKYETLATAFIGMALLGVGFGILWNGATDILVFLRGGELRQPGMLALVAAIISILLKEILYQYTVRVGKRCHSQAVVANAWHHRSDALSSIGTAAGIGGAILLGPHWAVLDPIAAVTVSFFIMRVSIRLLVPCLDELLEKSLPDSVEREIEGIMLEKMKEIIAEQLSVDAESVTEASSFKEDLGADSLDLFELVMALEDEYSVEIPAEELEKMSTVGDVMEYLKNHGVEA